MSQLQKMMERQSQLIEAYKPIVKSNGQELYDGPLPVDIKSRAGQDYLRRTIYNVMEEVGELQELYYERLAGQEGEGHTSKMYEESADIMHFLLELMILSGISHHQVQLGPVKNSKIVYIVEALSTSYQELSESDLFVALYFWLTQAGHELKLRPWKQESKPTDQNNYKINIEIAFHHFISLHVKLGLLPESMYEDYMLKSEKNLERITNGY